MTKQKVELSIVQNQFYRWALRNPQQQNQIEYVRFLLCLDRLSASQLEGVGHLLTLIEQHAPEGSLPEGGMG